MTSFEFRAKARAALGNNIFGNQWLLALVVVLVHSTVLSVAGYIGFGILSIILVGPLEFGLCRVFLKRTRGIEEIKVENLFSGFSNDFSGNLVTGLLKSIFLTLWGLLIIPGIIKNYSYAMTFYVKNDNPTLSATQCITESRKLMRGNKWRLFCLDLSFLGWEIVGSLCFGVGILWVIPYHEAARACFYEEISSGKDAFCNAEI